MKCRPMGAELFHGDERTDGQTDRHDEGKIVAFRNFANVPENWKNFREVGLPKYQTRTVPPN